MWLNVTLLDQLGVVWVFLPVVVFFCSIFGYFAALLGYYNHNTLFAKITGAIHAIEITFEKGGLSLWLKCDSRNSLSTHAYQKGYVLWVAHSKTKSVCVYKQFQCFIHLPLNQKHSKMPFTHNLPHILYARYSPLCLESHTIWTKKTY